jgi:coenzyme F420-dependent glucose-6-phosphate dehydrogenase
MVPGSAEIAGKLGDGLISVGGRPPEVYRALLQNFAQGARSAGKDPSRMPRAIELNVAYTSDTEKAISDLLEYWAGTFIPALYDQKIYTPKMSEENGQVVGPDHVRKTSCISPDPDAHVRFVQQYMELGFNEIYVHTAGPDQRAFLEGYGRDVIPRLRELAHRRETTPIAA